jgi:hypothetical protein
VDADPSAFSIANSVPLICSKKLASEFGFQLIEERRRRALMTQVNH